MQKIISYNKAITFDGFVDNWFKECKNYKLLNDWWKPECIDFMGNKIFKSRLIPLNKSYPDIPSENQFRPIVVLSAALKQMLLRFFYKLRRYMYDRMDKN